MPHAAPPRNSLAPQATRQQLDELDALLQRMLALPVNRLADETLDSAFHESAEAEHSTAVSEDNLPESSLDAEFRERSEFDEDGMARSWDSFAPEKEEIAAHNEKNEASRIDESSEVAPIEDSNVRVPASVTAAPSDPFVFDDRFAAIAEATTQGPEIRVTIAEPFDEPLPLPVAAVPVAIASWWAWPLAAVNGPFEWLARRGGRPGLWLLSQAGQTLLAFIGVIFWLLAIALLVDLGTGWLDLLSYVR